MAKVRDQNVEDVVDPYLSNGIGGCQGPTVVGAPVRTDGDESLGLGDDGEPYLGPGGDRRGFAQDVFVGLLEGVVVVLGVVAV